MVDGYLVALLAAFDAPSVALLAALVGWFGFWLIVVWIQPNWLKSLKAKNISGAREKDEGVSPAAVRGKPKVFISYRRSDSGYVATMLAEKLEAQFGEDSVFLDIDNIPLGVDFRDHIDNAVARCDILIALVGDLWLTCEHNGKRRLDDPGDFVRVEIEAALNRNIPVIPILTGNARMPVENELPTSMVPFAYRNASELRAGRDLHPHVDRLLLGLESHFKSPKRGRM